MTFRYEYYKISSISKDTIWCLKFIWEHKKGKSKDGQAGDPEINQAQQGLMPAGVAGDQSIPNREIDLSSIEFRYANIEQDAQAVADIWGGDAKIIYQVWLRLPIRLLKT